MKIKTILLFLALCVTMGVSAQQTDKTFTVKRVSFVMKPVAGGTFQMGYNLAYGECPVHSVTLSSYYIGQTEVTQALWQAVMGKNPSYFTGNDLPVETVSWDDCQAFIAKLSQLTGQKFRLPTEAEWEYAARGGKNSKGYEYSGSNKLGDVAWYNSKKTHPVATKQPNELGIYDMTGNVDEWCQDWYDDSYYRNSPSKDPSGPTSGTHRVYRGHNWYSTAKRCRVSSRDRHDPSGGNIFMGFRLALSSNSSASTATPKTAMTAEEMFEMGEDYYGKENYVEAVKWYRKAAEQGHALAQATLGVCYLEGTGITPNFTEAAKWFLKAAEQGQVEGQYAMGFCFYEGLGVTQSYAEAVKWYRKAAEQGQADAQNRMGLCYHSGKGVTKDDAEAVKWYRKAAEQGYAAAQYNLGLNYYEGTGVTQSYTEAVKWFRKAAEQGYVDAQNRMGLCYHSGKGVTKDDAEAVKWYRKAAEQGYAAAQYNLGIKYYDGTGVSQNKEEAKKWLRKAANQGYENAKQYLKKWFGEE